MSCEQAMMRLRSYEPYLDTSESPLLQLHLAEEEAPAVQEVLPAKLQESLAKHGVLDMQ